MKVDLGTCAVCGAKNSKFVESCYKCGAALPWAPGFVAPKTPDPPAKTPAPAPKPSAPQAAPKPQIAPPATTPSTPAPAPSSGIKTVVSPPLDLESVGGDKAPLTDSMAERAARRVPIPAWAIGAGVLGCIGLGMALMTAFGRGTAPATTAPALAPLPTMAPVASGTPAATAATAAPIATGTAAPIATASAPLPAASAPAVATPATSIPPTPAPIATTAPPSVPAAIPTTIPVAAPVVAAGPSFDALYLNTSSGTAEQKAAYWKTVQNTRISWRGDFVSLGTSLGGPLQIRCKNGAKTALVTVNLSTSPPQTLPAMQANQSIAVEGILSGYSAAGYQISQGRVS